MNFSKLFFSVLFLIILTVDLFSQVKNSGYERLSGKQFEKLSERTMKAISENNLLPYNMSVSVDSAFIDKDNKVLNIYYSKDLSYYRFREPWLNFFNSEIKTAQKRKIRRKYEVTGYIDTLTLSEYIPNLYRKSTDIDSTRFEVRKENDIVHVKNTEIPFNVTDGLENKHIALWGGHGIYYSNDEKIWKWQRPNLFTTVEDMENFSYVVPYIMPMLQNAGANVYYPKERDINSDEFIIDIDNSSDTIEKTKNVEIADGGFLLKEFYVDHENPFVLGKHLKMRSSKLNNEKDSIIYNFKVAKTGEYAVYISYTKGNNVSDVKYTVHHDGGETVFMVNQKMGYSTWVFLGTFQFGVKNSKVIVYNTSEEEGIISSDAVKIGGGLTRVRREGTFSPKPAYMNAARYFLQYSGIPNDEVYSLSKYKSDYKDDYQGRGEWVNYLLGGIYSHNRDSTLQGLNIPIDLSLAFHTDAGTTKTDSVIGTLIIHSTKGLKNERFFPDGRSRFASRDLADIVETEILKIIEDKHNSDWTSREIWDKKYAEATYTNIPSILIELLSHQNFGDEKYGLNPNFKFDVSRAIYKGVLKYLAYFNNRDYVVTPLAVNSFSINYRDKKFVLNWEQTIDKTEETANPDAYIVYTKVDDGGFDNGVLVKGNEYIFDRIEEGKIYSFKVKAINKGGVSFDSEMLSAGIRNFKDNPILIVNAFDKVSGPEFFDTDSLGGFSKWHKSAIADGIEYSFTGSQYNFDKNDPWISDPMTGHGASYSDYEGIKVVGNTFDYPYKHGKKFSNLNLSFVSTSAKAFERNPDKFANYNKIDLIYGKQSVYNLNQNPKAKDYSLFRQSMRDALDQWLSEDKSLLVSGAFIAKDVFLDNKKDTLRSNWVKNKLQYSLYSDWACQTGEVIGKNQLHISKNPSEKIYELRSVDALKPIGGATVIYRYKENNFPAVVLGKKNGYRVLSYGFPIESVIENQEELFEEIAKQLLWVK
ncbi:MAG: hypothetical protein ABFR32_06890 [Bacteroidota bacterium]